jgi:spore coat polysaccharide biosynthesis protein SpsF
VIGVFVAARMSSRRFPGKALAPFRGRPMIAHVIDRVRGVDAIASDHIVLLTSTDPTDDPLAAYARALGVDVFRGALDPVFDRFQRCAVNRPLEWVARVNGDSPLIRPAIIEAVIAHADARADLVTTIAPRTLPRGQNPELIRTEVLLATDAAALTSDEQEHVTAFFHHHPERFRIVNVGADRPRLADLDFSVDTIDDLQRLEAMSDAEIEALLPLSFV